MASPAGLVLVMALALLTAGCGRTGLTVEMRDGGADSILPPTGAVEVSGGMSLRCVRRLSGRVDCWGGGAGSLCCVDQRLPAPVPNLDDAVALDTGAHHSCAVRRGGRVACWGASYFGELGFDPDIPGRGYGYRAEDVPGIGGALDVDLGLTYSCALLQDGRVQCWGAGGAGQLGDGRLDTLVRRRIPGLLDGLYSAFPRQVHGIDDAVDLSAGWEHACAVRAGGELWCWGAGEHGQLGNGTMAGSAVPVRVPGLPAVSSVSAGGWHTCAIGVEGGLYCWGFNGAGELGDGTTTARLMPVRARSVSGVVQVSASISDDLTCALTESGASYCWGDNWQGALGVGEGRSGAWGSRHRPARVEGIDDAVDIGAFTWGGCAARADGSVACWGVTLGSGSVELSTSPVPVPGFP